MSINSAVSISHPMGAVDLILERRRAGKALVANYEQTPATIGFEGFPFRNALVHIGNNLIPLAVDQEPTVLHRNINPKRDCLTGQVVWSGLGLADFRIGTEGIRKTQVLTMVHESESLPLADVPEVTARQKCILMNLCDDTLMTPAAHEFLRSQSAYKFPLPDGAQLLMRRLNGALNLEFRFVTDPGINPTNPALTQGLNPGAPVSENHIKTTYSGRPVWLQARETPDTGILQIDMNYFVPAIKS